MLWSLPMAGGKKTECLVALGVSPNFSVVLDFVLESVVTAVIFPVAADPVWESACFCIVRAV